MIPIRFESKADDVLYLNKALQELRNGKSVFDLGAGGTSFRFFLGRLSRLPGSYVVHVHPALLQRPHLDLYEALKQLGTIIEARSERTIHVEVKGWQNTCEVQVKSDVSSQFASAILLNAWNLETPLKITLIGEVASRSFLELTQNLCRNSGMKFHWREDVLLIESAQKVTASELNSEVDASSVFTLSCFGLLFGSLSIKPFVNFLGQPDLAFLDFFNSLNIKFNIDNDEFKISRQSLSQSITLDIKNCPDLFPVLCAWLSFCPGEHKVYGAPNLVNKESNRILKTQELLSLAGIKTQTLHDGMIVHGQNRPRPKKFDFNPAQDHRMAFAAAIFAFAGFEVALTDIQVVNKSFPQFWQILGLLND